MGDAGALYMSPRKPDIGTVKHRGTYHYRKGFE